MFWVIQEDLFHENGREELLRVLQKLDIPHQVVKIVPFSHELIPPVEVRDNIIVNGSILLAEIAREKNWNPGSFLNDNFDYRVWYPRLSCYLLNHDAVFTTVERAEPDMDDIFVRPVLDNKSFNGRVMSSNEFYAWQSSIMRGEDSQVFPTTEILYAAPKKIGQEHRHFIIDGAVITSSRYKLNGRLNVSSMVDQRIVDFAARMASIFSPARAFVLDTYIAGSEIGIVEMGCITAAGFYSADIQKLVMALESMNVTQPHQLPIC
jgi:hypothetical protein